MDKTTIVRQALRTYVRSQLRRSGNTLSPQQWLTLLNCYIRRQDAEECADLAGIRPLEAEMWYTRFAMAVISYAVRLTRIKYAA